MKKVNTTNKKIDKMGFTLVELLATLAVLSIVLTIVFYIALNVINNAKEKSYIVTINNVEKEASNYAIENSNILSWRDSDVFGYEYQCIKVGHLIEKGYFSNDLLESSVAKDIKVKKENYIYLERNNKTKNVNKKILLHDGVGNSFANGLCGRSNVEGGISFEVVPVGKEVNGYSKSKKIYVNYNLYNVSNTIYDYKYNYYFDNDETIKGNNTFDKHNVKKEIEIIKNGNLFAAIKDKSNNDIITGNKNISYIDRTGPIIDDNYNSNEIVRKNVIVPLKVSDNEAGLSNDNLTKDDITVFIGNDEIEDINLDIETNNDNNKIYNLTINDLLHKGPVKIIVEGNVILDNLDNGNVYTVLEPNLSFSNEYKISYDSNGGTGNVSSQICVFNSSCVLSKNSFTKSGYTFVGWNTKANGSGMSYSSGYKFDKYNLTEDITLYAQWKINKVYINYNVNGGIVTAQTKNDSGTIYNWSVDNDGIVLRNGSILQYKIDHNKELDSDGLANWNNGKYLEITKTGYKAQSNNEWKCLKGCSKANRTYDHAVSYKSSDFCDTSLKDCNVVIGVNWVANKYKVTLDNKNATTSGTTSVTATYDSVMPDITIPTKKGYKFDGYYDNEMAVEMMSFVEDYTNVKRVNFVNANNGWKMTNDDKGTHIQVKLTVQDSSLSSVPSLDFNDVGLSNDKEYKITGGNGIWTYFVDFDITNEMVTKRSYDYHTAFRFIDVNGTTANTKITVNMAVKGGKKYYSSSGSGLWNYDIAGNSTLYAKWIGKTYINYVVPNGWPAVASQTCTYGKICTIAKYSHEDGTKYFDVWSSPGVNGSGTDTTWTNWSGTWSYDNGQYGITNDTLTLKAVTDNYYTINFIANGGTGSLATITNVKKGANIVIPSVTDSSNTFKRTGYTFNGWSTKTDSTDDGYGWTGWSGTWGEWNNKYGISNYTLNLYARWSVSSYSISFNANGGSFLPNGYTPLEYIQSSGTQYIDTGYYLKTESIGIYFDGTVMTASSDQSLFGNEEYIDTYGNRYFSGIPYYHNNAYHMYIADGSKGSFSNSFGTRFNLIFKTTVDKKLSVYKNNSALIANSSYNGSVITKANASLTSSAANTVGNIFLFANHNTNRGTTNAALQLGASMRVYGFRLIDNGQVVRNMIPAINSSDVVGLYDSVTGVFYKNLGSGSFIAGPVVNSYSTDKDTFSLPSASRNGYSFVGWNTKADGTGTNVTQVAKGSSGNKLLYAQWVDDLPPTIPTYTAFYDDGSGNYTSGTETNKQVNTTIAAIDKGSGVSYIQYCEYNKSNGTCGSWNTFSFGESGGLSIADSNGKRTGTEVWTLVSRNQYYRFRACDKNGNCSVALSNENPKHDGYAYNINYRLDLSGSVNITGENTYGKTLTANVNNPYSANLKYQWYSNSSNSTSGGTEISGANSSTYKIGSGLVGKYIYVQVTATKTGYNEAKWYDVTGPVSPLKTAETGSCATLTYTGSSQTLASGEVNATYSDNSGINADTYTVKVKADDDYAFSDGTTSKTLTCEIKPKAVKITFYRNNAASITPSGGSASTEDSITQSCYMSDKNGCKIISPKISGSTKTPTVLGWNTSANANSSSWKQNTEKVFTENAKYYAQTEKSAVTYSITTNRNDDDATGTDAVNSCSIKAVYNGDTQSTSCKVIVPDNPYSLTGYEFVGLNSDYNGNGKEYIVGDEVSISSNVTLYVQWKELNKVRIRYSVNGGTVSASTTALDGTVYNWSNVNNFINKDGVIFENVIINDDKTTSDGLPDYNYDKYLKITKKGYSGESGAEWICLEGCTESNKTFDQTKVYNASDFCDTSKGSCEVLLGVNWRINKLTIKYSVNEGTVTASTKADDGTKYTWTTDSKGLIYKNGIILITTINYGEATGENGLSDANNTEYLNITRDGYGIYATKEWKCLSGCTTSDAIFDQTKVYNASDFCDIASGSCEVLLGVNWLKVKSFTTNGAWWVWAKPGIVWKERNKSIYVYKDSGGNESKTCAGYSACSYQKNYLIGTWQKDKTVYIRMDSNGKYISEDEIVRLSNNSGDERTFIRVWVRESHIDEAYGCVYSGDDTKYKVGRCGGYLQKMTIKGSSYWSVWAPWACDTKNCPRNEVSIKSFPSSPPF